MRPLRLIAAATTGVMAATMTLAHLDADPIGFYLAYGGATLAGWAYLYIKEDEQRMPTAAKYYDLAVRLRWEIKEEGYHPGDNLPSTRELARRFTTTRATVNRALHLLADEGIITIVHGRGAFVVGATHASRARMVENHIREHLRRGDRIERAEALALSWSVSPSTVRRVLAKLRVEGAIRRRPDGTYEAA